MIDSFIGGGETARGPRDQPLAGATLQAGQPLADHGETDAQVPRRAREAAPRQDALEGAKLIEIVKQLST